MEQTKKLPEREQTKDTFTLRIPEQINNRIKMLSEDIGISQNALILLFINWGLNSFSEITRIQGEELRRILFQSQQ